MTLKTLKIDTTWTLFLDRDGVINKRIEGDYIRLWDQFEFLPGVTEALRSFATVYGRILVVSNQQGVGKGLMTNKDVRVIHDRMTSEIRDHGGRIDRVYHSPFLERENSIHRKPNVGMALQARQDFPEIRFRRSVMCGDSVSDMVFGKRLNMTTVFISTKTELIRQGHEIIDFVYPDLLSFAKDLSGS